MWLLRMMTYHLGKHVDCVALHLLRSRQFNTQQ